MKSSNRSKGHDNFLFFLNEIIFDLKKSVLYSTMLKIISFAQSCTLEVYIDDPMK